MAEEANGVKDEGRTSASESDAKSLDSPSGISGVGNGASDLGLGTSPANGTPAMDHAESMNPSQEAPKKQSEGELLLYPVVVKTQTGEKIELQLSPGDSVIDIRQFLLDAPETCFFTCYDLILRTKDGSVHHMEDYNELSEVADIASGGCSIEMVAALYDERSIRSHVRRTRELLSLSSMQSSLSTLLALQHESTQKKETMKMESVELDGLGFMEDTPGALPKLMTSSPKEIKCIESIMFSSLNPPPSYRRLVGDLIYIDVATLEGNKICVTGTTKGFYVNSSTINILDPKPSKPSYEASTLIGLLQRISPKFKKVGFREILDQKASAHPFENVQVLLSPNAWLGAYPVPDHRRDAARSEESLVLSYGSEPIGMQRDWNEELQACRELPHTTLQERILRGRALYKVTSEFVEAATKGAIGVINRCIPPINPPDPECFYMYVHNNIFFSFAVDADLGYISKDPDLSPKPIQLVSRNDDTIISSSSTKSSSSTLCETTGSLDSCTSTNSESGQLKSLSDPTSDKTAEAQMLDGEQATYASANNDLKGTKAYQEADVPGLYNLAMAIIDYRGYRVVAQSIIPGILQGDKSDSLLYGSVDNGKKICWNESFHSKVVEAAKHLHLKEHTVLDGSGNIVSLAAPVECKGIVGTDDRHYLLDLMRLTARDANYMGPGHRFCVLRPELVSLFCEAEAAERSELDAKSKVKACEATNLQASTNADEVLFRAETQNSSVQVFDKAGEESGSHGPRILPEEILLNPNVLTEFKLAGSEQEIAADEAIVKKAASYLLNVIIPKFVQDLCSLEISPMDGQTLTESLHSHGINIRYLGKVAGMVKHLPHLWDICTVEIIVRSAKHIIKDILRETHDHDIGSTVAHFFNCLFGLVQHTGTKSSPNSTQSKTSRKSQENIRNLHKYVKGQRRKSHGASFAKSHVAHQLLTSNELWFYIQEFARLKYEFELPDNASTLVKKISVIRNLCQKVGITIAARKYNLENLEPFQTSDILDLQPVVKHSIPLCKEARVLMETGKVRLAEGMLSESHALLSEAFSLLQQITGPMHRDVANCCRYLAMVLYHAGDMAGAIVHQHKELIINERCLGLDHPDTAHSYGNMALFYHGLNQTELALRHMSRTLLLLSLSSGPEHPDIAATFINVAMMYQDAGNMNATLRYLQEALKKNERLLGPEHIQTAVCYHALAIAFSSMGTYKLSIQHEKKTYDILAKQLGKEDSRTQDSENWLKKFTLLSQQVDAQKQKGQALDSAEACKAIDLLKARPDLLQAFQAAAVGSGAASGLAANKSLSAALIGEALPRGRGVDERAARAAAEVRKKAAAKGLPVRQSGAPVQSMPQLSQILNIINSGATNLQSDEGKVDAGNGRVPDGTSVGVQDTNGTLLTVQAPVGLGMTLASLDSKKQKSKSKVAAS